MSYNDVIEKYYPEDDPLRRLLLLHSRQVADKCLEACDRHPELQLDRQFVEEGAMLHDIGIRWCHAPGIGCTGDEPYIRHGMIGGGLLRREGLLRHARVCERHTGAGITKEQIEARGLPLPPADYLPETLEEQLVCYADNFFSKSHPERMRTPEQVAQSLEKFGSDGVERFWQWHRLFS